MNKLVCFCFELMTCFMTDDELGLCSVFSWLDLCHSWGDKAGSATPGGISTAPPLPTGSSWVGDPPLCRTESIFDIERILPKQGIDHTVRSSLCQGQMFILKLREVILCSET